MTLEVVMAASRGPVPKRDAERRRRNKDDGGADRAAGATVVPVPEPSGEWHEIARMWFVSLKDSGQSVFYEPSDWALAYLIAESMSRDLSPQFVGINERTGDVEMASIPLKGASLSSYLKAMSSLMVTEGDRRRMRLELDRSEPSPEVPADVAVMSDYRTALGG